MIKSVHISCELIYVSVELIHLSDKLIHIMIEPGEKSIR